MRFPSLIDTDKRWYAGETKSTKFDGLEIWTHNLLMIFFNLYLINFVLEIINVVCTQL